MLHGSISNEPEDVPSWNPPNRILPDLDEQPSVELAVRDQDGYHVELRWVKATNEVFVEVLDPHHAHFVIPVPESVSPLKVFNHPFAFATA